MTQTVKVTDIANIIAALQKGNFELATDFEYVETDTHYYAIEHEVESINGVKVEGIYVEFPAREHFADAKEAYNLGEIDYIDFSEMSEYSDFGDLYDYDNPKYITVDGVQYEVK